VPNPIKVARRLVNHLFAKVFPVKYKEAHELSYWRSRLDAEQVLTNGHYQYFYTEYFGLHPGFYDGKKIIDIGCGPRGSLEWATNAAERVGLDTLALKYLAMGARQHAMQYIAAGAEAIPYPDHYFDVICSFNSLDHVDDLQTALLEINRVLKTDGVFLLIVEINHLPTATEPAEIRDLEATFGSLFAIGNPRLYEIGDAHDIYGQLRADVRFDKKDSTDRPAILTAVLTNKVRAEPPLPNS
jgi:SAM-dependent methyltransferase